MKILEYRPGFGTFTAGLENFPETEVTNVLKLDKNAYYGYNRIHKQWFSTSLDTIATYTPDEPIDLAYFTPEFGSKVSGHGQNNFFFYDFQNCLTFLDNNHPKFAIFQTEISAIQHLSSANTYIRDGFNQVSNDKLIHKLHTLGYRPHLFVFDEAQYGIPLHRKFALYIATPKNYKLQIPRGLYTATGQGPYLKYRTIQDAISDLDTMGNWVNYKTQPKNTLQKALRDPNTDKVTWNHQPKIKQNTIKKIAKIKQGSNNNTIKPHARSNGYNRAQWDKICRTMDEKFYLVSSTGDSIHPLKNRPFSIREGCRIHGLPDKLSFDLKTPRPALAKLIHQSISPLIGELLGLSLGCKF